MKDFRRLQRQQKPYCRHAPTQKHDGQKQRDDRNNRQIDRNAGAEYRLPDELGKAQTGEIPGDAAYDTGGKKLRQNQEGHGKI